MGRIYLLFVAAAFFILPVSGFAEAMPEASNIESSDSGIPEDAAPASLSDAADDGLAWEQFDDPNFDPNAADADIAVETAAEAMASAPEATSDVAPDASMPMGEAQAGVELTGADEFETSRGIVLGPQGIDDQGRTGRLHTVSSGDTLWDLAAAYLGTAWVWPSVWIDNDDIDNPHLIMPGDRIWITANEMRVVTDAEAESFLDPASSVPEVAVIDSMAGVEGGELEDMQVDDPDQPLAALETEEEDPSTLDAFPVAVAGQEPESMASGRQITVSRREAIGFVSEDDMAGASSIVDSSVERTFLAAGDPVVLGMGEGDVEVGDQFTVFKAIEEVRDVETNRILGHHVDILGWLEVKELTGDSAIAEIRMSYSLIERGVRVMPRTAVPFSVTSRSTPDAIEGKVVFLPSGREIMGDGGYVYLNRGEFHGVEVGSELEVFEPGMIVNDRSRRVDVRTPDHSVAKLVVVSVTDDGSVAFVLTSNRELQVGDDVRPRIARLAQR